MTKDDLSGQRLDAINLADTDLSEANLSGSSLRYAQMQRAKLAGADLSESDLKGADLRDADLSEATLRRTRLTEADLRAAGLERAATLDEVDLSGAKGVPAEVAEKQGKGSKDRQDSQTKTDRPASEQAQAEQDRQLETGEESPA
jgi:uncharacterized protein YjbI with pentapeptide repeats